MVKMVITMTDENDKDKHLEAPDIEKKISINASNNTGKSAHPLRFLDEYFPDENQMELKGRLDRPMVVEFSTLEVLFDMYPEIDDLRPMVKTWSDQIEKRLTSVDGQSRDEFKDILVSLLSGYKSEEQLNEDGSFFKQLFDASGGADSD